MVRYMKTGGAAIHSPTLTTGRSTPEIEPYGVTILSYTSDENVVLKPPVVGVEKTLISVNATSAAGPTVWASTGTGITISGLTSVATATKIQFGASTAHQVVKMIGVSSVKWVVTGSWPVSSSAPGPTYGTS